ncbi:family 16 glycosylhydrolase [Dankookia sp. GCM10030260]|uniref:family 16 glycosylhydrolase n=1 Tax=Dankookia sp. GCM10030260 TaxID=3273390 RepID=UPI00360C714E
MIFLNAAGVALSTSQAPTRWFTSSSAGVTLNGTATADFLSHSGSYASLAGGAGDDTYCVWNTTHTIQEFAGGGIDTLQSYASRTILPGQVENLQLMWRNQIGIGNALDNIITAGDGAQTLDGGAGNDVLAGGAGADLFIVAAGKGSEVITDFLSGTDQVRLDGHALYNFAMVRAAMTQVGADTVLALGNGESLVLRDTQVAGFGAADFVLPEAPRHAGMYQTFNEEFDGLSSSASGSGVIWKTSLGISKQDRTQPVTKEAGYYSDASVGVNPFSVADGVLDIAATAGSNPSGLAYNTGIITTARSFAQQYGYFEARLDLPAGRGFWPAFWLMPASGAWPPEIDILEALGQDPTTAYHSLHSTTAGDTTITVRNLPNLSAGFHTYGLDWQADTITWLIDGREVAQLATPADMHQPMYMLLNLAVGGVGSWPGVYDPAKPDGHLLIDYVRAWQRGDGMVTGPDDVARLGGVYTLKADGVSDLYDFSKAKAMLHMDATGLSLAGTHTIWGSPLGSDLRGGPGNVNFAGGIGADSFSFGAGTSRVLGGGGNDSFTLTRGMIAVGNQILDFHLDLSAGDEHDQLRLQGFSDAAQLEFVKASGQTQYYRVVDGDYASPLVAILVANGSGHLAEADYQFI